MISYRFLTYLREFIHTSSWDYFSVRGPSREERLSRVWCLCWLGAEQKSPHSTDQTGTSGLSSHSRNAKVTRLHRLHSQRAAPESGCASRPFPILPAPSRASARLRQLPLQVEGGKGARSPQERKEEEVPLRGVNLHYCEKGNRDFTLPVFMK